MAYAFIKCYIMIHHNKIKSKKIKPTICRLLGYIVIINTSGIVTQHSICEIIARPAAWLVSSP